MNSIGTLKAALDSHQPREITSELPDAGILVPVTRDLDQPKIILTRRAQHMNTHKGQVAFPGGKRDETDHSLEFTALRECHEEIGVPSNEITLLGHLDSLPSISGFKVTPFVGVLADGFQVVKEDSEVHKVFGVPFAFFQDKANRQKQYAKTPFGRTHYYIYQYKLVSINKM